MGLAERTSDQRESSPAARDWRHAHRGLQRLALMVTLALFGCASSLYATSRDVAAASTSDKALYDYVSQYPLHRGYMYCHVAIEYSSDYKNRFCPGSRIFIRIAQRALKQPALDTHDDPELRRILDFIAKSVSESQDPGPKQGLHASLPPRSLALLVELYKQNRPEEQFLYCYADIAYFTDPQSAYCRYTLAKLNLQLFEGQEQQIADHDTASLFLILHDVILKEKQ